MPSLIPRVRRFSTLHRGVILIAVVLSAFFVAIIDSSRTVHASGTTGALRAFTASTQNHRGFLVSPNSTMLQTGEPRLTAPDNAGRLMVLVFDTTALSPDQLDNAVTSSLTFVDKDLAAADRVAVVTISTRLGVVSDFTSDREALHNALSSSRLKSDTQNAAPTATSLSELRLRAIATLCQTLSALSQRKAVMYFSGGLAGAGADNQAELNATTNTCRRGNVLIYPVDVRGLAAVVAEPGRSAPRGGASLFNGRQ